MRNPSRPTILPTQFEARFLVAYILRFLPVLTAVGGVLWFGNHRWAPWIIGKYCAVLIFIAWRASRRAGDERNRIEQCARMDAELAPGFALDSSASHLLPLCGASLLLGCFFALVKHDARWLLLTGGLGFFLAAGLLLSWVVYERWLASQLRSFARMASKSAGSR